MTQLIVSSVSVPLTHLLMFPVDGWIPPASSITSGLKESGRAAGWRKYWPVKLYSRSSSTTGSLRPKSGGIEMTVDMAQLTAIIAIIRVDDLQASETLHSGVLCSGTYLDYWGGGTGADSR